MATITAVSTLGFSLSPIEVALERIRGYGFSRVEIAEMLTHSKHFPIDTVDPERIRALLERYSLTPVAANVSMAVVDAGTVAFQRVPTETQSAAETTEIVEAKSRRYFHKLHVKEQADLYLVRARKLIEKARIAGIPKVGIQAGRRTQIEDIGSELKAAALVIDEVAEYAKERNVGILLEMPHVWDLYYDVEKAKTMLSYLKSDNVGVTVDSTHWHVSGYDIDDYLDFLGERLWHVHLRDAAGEDSRSGDYELEKTPGRGEVDFAGLGESLDRHGHRGSVTLETEYKNYRSPDEVDAENHFALDYLRRIGWGVMTNGV